MTRKITALSAALLATTSLAHAGGVERQGQSPAILFEDGNYVEFGFTYVDPELSGSQLIPAGPTSPAGSNSGDIGPAYSFYNFSLVSQITDEFSLAVIYDQPIGADVDYGPNGGVGYLYGSGFGSQAEIRSQAVTLAGRYQINDRISAYAGLRLVTADGSVTLFNGSGSPMAPAGSRYAMEAEGSTELGFMIGGAYEIPDIALRVSLTYYSATEHTFTGTEGNITPAGVEIFGPTTFNTTIPQQLLLEAQTGVAEGTLVFGSIRWVDWSEFEITPPGFAAATGSSLVSYDNDTFTYTLGGARRLTEDLAILGSISYEASQGGFSGNLGPTDGRFSLGLGMRYDIGDWRLSGGINYTFVGDAQTEAPGALMAPPGTAFGDFTDNSAIGVGFRIGYTF